MHTYDGAAISGGGTETEGERAIKCWRLSSRLRGRSAPFGSSCLRTASPRGWDDDYTCIYVLWLCQRRLCSLAHVYFWISWFNKMKYIFGFIQKLIHDWRDICSKIDARLKGHLFKNWCMIEGTFVSGLRHLYHQLWNKRKKSDQSTIGRTFVQFCWNYRSNMLRLLSKGYYVLDTLTDCHNMKNVLTDIEKFRNLCL